MTLRLPETLVVTLPVAILDDEACWRPELGALVDFQVDPDGEVRVKLIHDHYTLMWVEPEIGERHEVQADDARKAITRQVRRRVGNQWEHYARAAVEEAWRIVDGCS